MSTKYRLRFLFDYHCGGCLWSDNDAAFEIFGFGCLDSDKYDSDGNIIEEARIKLPNSIRKRVLQLDKLYTESLNWDDPTGQSLWDNAQWQNFYEQTKDLHRQIVLNLSNEFEVLYNQT
jgi:hypothetical protein